MVECPPYPEESLDPAISFRASAFTYEGRAGQAVRRLKYERATALASFMAAKVYETASDQNLLQDRLVIPVPIHWSRRCQRGFNQAELLCETFPKLTVETHLLVRRKATLPQARLSLSLRETNLKGAFAVRGSCEGLSVLLVDDVITSGNTARECARTLLSAGAFDVGVVTFAGEF